MGRVVALLTDFGLCDPYVGQMKAVLSAAAPEACIIDLSHNVEPFNIAQGGFFLAADLPYLSEDAVVAAVVDPGVGTERRIIACRFGRRIVLAPDNGLVGLSLHVHDADEIRIVEQPEHHKPAPTFHGRDIFMPAVVRLLKGESFDALGPACSSEDVIRDKSFEQARVSRSGSLLRIAARTLHIDHFGNCILNLSIEAYTDLYYTCRTMTMTHPRNASVLCAKSYGYLPDWEFGLLPGSQGFAEIAFNQASAAHYLELSIGDEVRLEAPLFDGIA